MKERGEGPNAWPRTGIRTFSLVFLMDRSFPEEEESDDERINESEKGRKGRWLLMVMGDLKEKETKEEEDEKKKNEKNEIQFKKQEQRPNPVWWCFRGALVWLGTSTLELEICCCQERRDEDEELQN
jgi:hypothetical protein